tara:strand:- start:2601 stop:2753 length:153 start_codon:yes stop_codon:yes gene_type:complete
MLKRVNKTDLTQANTQSSQPKWLHQSAFRDADFRQQNKDKNQAHWQEKPK